MRSLKKAGIPAGGYANVNIDDLYDFDEYPQAIQDNLGYMQALVSYKLAGYKLKMIGFISACRTCDVRWKAAQRFVKECKEEGGDCELEG